MEHRSDQQALVNPGGATTSGIAVASTSAPPASGGVVFRRAMRLLLRRFLYLLVRITQPLRRYAAFLLVVAGLLGVIGWLSYQVWAPRAAAPRDVRAALIEPSEDVENYIKGQQNYNAELMWTSLSPESQASQLEGGASKQSLQSRIDAKKERGLRFSRYQYVGGVELEDGGNMYFYSVDVQLQNQSAKLPMTFLVDNDGKVSDIFSPSLLSDLTLPSE
jgi:hypothetical protein